MKRLILLVIVLSMSLGVSAQFQYSDTLTSDIINRVYDYLLEDVDEGDEPDFEQVVETLQELSQNKIDLNRATKQDLQQLFFLTDYQMEDILYTVFRGGKFRVVDDLHKVSSLPEYVIYLLTPFVTVDSSELSVKDELRKAVKYSFHRVGFRFDGVVEPRKGYQQKDGSGYLGSPFYTSLRYKFQASNHIAVALTAEKDAGEPFWNSYHKGYDHYSGYVKLANVKHLKMLVVGDYRATFGQWLLLGQSFYRRSGNVVETKARSTGITPKSSTEEYSYFRGLGTTLQFGKFNVSALYSFRNMDGDTVDGSFSTFKKDGLFRTSKDYRLRHTIPMHVLGANVNYASRHFSVGITGYYSHTSVVAAPDSLPYQLYAFRGKNQGGVSLDYQVRYKFFSFWGETAMANNLSFATINGINLMPVNGFNIIFKHRYYSPRYQLYYANGYHRYNTSNEQGYYLGAEFEAFGGVKLSAAADVHKSEWLRYLVSAPSQGTDVLLRADYEPSERLLVYLRCRMRTKMQNHQQDNNIESPQHERLNFFRLGCNYYIRNFVGKSLLEFSETRWYGESSNFGFVFSQQLNYEFKKAHLNLSCAYIFFDAANYDNRSYIYERDLPGVLQVPMLYGVGNRYMLMLRWSAFRNFDISAKWQQLFYADGRTNIGSSLETIAGNHRSDFRVYVSYKFDRLSLRKHAAADSRRHN